MSFISLRNPLQQSVLSVDREHRIFRLELEGQSKEMRLKAFMIEVLYALFKAHPQSLSYVDLTEILKHHHFIVTDSTRLHRKLSEIRKKLLSLHPSLGDLLENHRGEGYGLPLNLKPLDPARAEPQFQFKNPTLILLMKKIQTLIETSIELSRTGQSLKTEYGYVMDRSPFREKLTDQLNQFEDLKTELLKTLRNHPAEFWAIRIEYVLAQLKTYIGLARISEYPISQTQWVDWFEMEVWAVFEILQKAIKAAE